MGSIFQTDGPVFRVLSRFADLMILNLLWIVCSLPVITIGASTTALYSVLLKVAKDEESYLIKSYFKAFIENFRQGTVIYLIFLVISLIMAADLYIVTNMSEIGSGLSMMKIPAIAGLVLVFLIAQFAFPILARFENTVKNTIKNAFLMELGNLPWFLLITVINCLIPFVCIIYPEGMVKAFIALVFFGFSIPAYLNSCVFRKIFEKYEK